MGGQVTQVGSHRRHHGPLPDGLILRNGDGRQYAQDRERDQQLGHRESAVVGLHRSMSCFPREALTP